MYFGKKLKAFSMVELMMVLLISALIIAAIVPIITRKHMQLPTLATHGAYLCYYGPRSDSDNTTVLREAKWAGANMDRQIFDRETSQCVFEPPKKAAFFQITAIGGGGGGADSGFKGSIPEPVTNEGNPFGPFGITSNMLNEFNISQTMFTDNAGYLIAFAKSRNSGAGGGIGWLNLNEDFTAEEESYGKPPCNEWTTINTLTKEGTMPYWVHTTKTGDQEVNDVYMVKKTVDKVTPKTCHYTIAEHYGPEECSTAWAYKDKIDSYGNVVRSKIGNYFVQLSNCGISSGDGTTCYPLICTSNNQLCDYSCGSMPCRNWSCEGTGKIYDPGYGTCKTNCPGKHGIDVTLNFQPYTETQIKAKNNIPDGYESIVTGSKCGYYMPKYKNEQERYCPGTLTRATIPEETVDYDCPTVTQEEVCYRYTLKDNADPSQGGSFDDKSELTETDLKGTECKNITNGVGGWTLTSGTEPEYTPKEVCVNYGGAPVASYRAIHNVYYSGNYYNGSEGGKAAYCVSDALAGGLEIQYKDGSNVKKDEINHMYTYTYDANTFPDDIDENESYFYYNARLDGTAGADEGLPVANYTKEIYWFPDLWAKNLSGVPYSSNSHGVVFAENGNAACYAGSSSNKSARPFYNTNKCDAGKAAYTKVEFLKGTSVVGGVKANSASQGGAGAGRKEFKSNKFPNGDYICNVNHNGDKLTDTKFVKNDVKVNGVTVVDNNGNESVNSGGVTDKYGAAHSFTCSVENAVMLRQNESYDHYPSVNAQNGNCTTSAGYSNKNTNQLNSNVNLSDVFDAITLKSDLQIPFDQYAYGYILIHKDGTPELAGKYKYNVRFDTDKVAQGSPGNPGDSNTIVVKNVPMTDRIISLGVGGSPATISSNGGAGNSGSPTSMGSLITAKGGAGGYGSEEVPIQWDPQRVYNAVEYIAEDWCYFKLKLNSLPNGTTSYEGRTKDGLQEFLSIKGQNYCAPYENGNKEFRWHRVYGSDGDGPYASHTGGTTGLGMFSFLTPEMNNVSGNARKAFDHAGQGGRGGGVEHFCLASQRVTTFEGKIDFVHSVFRKSALEYDPNFPDDDLLKNYRKSDGSLKDDSELTDSEKADKAYIQAGINKVNTTPALRDNNIIPKSCYTNAGYNLISAGAGRDGILLIRW